MWLNWSFSFAVTMIVIWLIAFCSHHFIFSHGKPVYPWDIYVLTCQNLYTTVGLPSWELMLLVPQHAYNFADSIHIVAKMYVQLITIMLFQMMSVYPNPIISSHIMQSLQTIALSAAQHIGMLGRPHNGQICCFCTTDKALKLTVVL